MKDESSREPWSAFLLPVALIIGLAVLLSLNAGPVGGEESMATPMEHWLRLVVGYVAAGAELSAALVIGIAVLRGILAFLAHLAGDTLKHLDSSELIRLRVGRGLALGLEFTIASDIIRTAVAPTREIIINLGAIVLLRTLLNYFLEREIRQGEERRAAAREAV